ncbi:two-component system response regulator [Paramagnetospirillum kuznetsovii]|uniref:Two-component system response regulator n=1 Tax=Paramagnetospirillum kuznetsovii TaxID=2053833 RepID=A0A364P2A9_9PROT|nr:HD domain-containing phosphohydrolase [Paramagnetospirillum kuznetsovii]RAU23297.1 two-component system response regulator [Paramagnetospirillum kuznetsovii]
MNAAPALSDAAKAHSRKVLVAVIDANADHRRQVATALTSFYQVVDFSHFDMAMEGLAQTPPCVLLLDEMAMPRMGGDPVKTARRLLPGVPIIRTLNRAIAHLGETARDTDACLEKPYRRSSLIRTISNLVNKSVENRWESLAPQYRDSLQRTVESFNTISDLIDRGEPLEYKDVTGACSSLVDAVSNHDFKVILDNVKGHDNYSYVHSLRVATLLSLFGHTIGLKGEDMNLVTSGGLVHDIGKMKIPHEVLNKPGRLDDSELQVMRSHVPKSVDYLKLCESLPKGVVTIAEQHHEKLDGSGYPNGLKGGQLNELARMASIVDIFSALTDRRVYKEPMAPEEALTLMTDRMAADIDLNLLTLFKGMLLDAVTTASG